MIWIYIISVVSNCVATQHQDDSHSPTWHDDEDVLLQIRKFEGEIGSENHEASWGLERKQKVLQRLADRASDPEAIQEAMASVGLSNYSLALVDVKSFVARTDPTGWSKVTTAAGTEEGTDAMFEAGGLVFASLGSILGKAISGQGITKGDWLNLAESAVQAVVSGSIAILSLAFTAAAGPLGLLGALIGSMITELFALGAETPPTTGELINRALAKERLDDNKDFWHGLAEEMSVLSGLFVESEHTDNTDAKTAWYMIMQHDLAVNRNKVFGDCMDSSTWSSDTCTTYIEDGMIEVMVPYAEAHINMLWELLMLFMENPNVDIALRQTQVNILHLRLQELGAQYHAALKHAWDIYYPWRMRQIWNPFMSDVTKTYSWWNESWTYARKSGSGIDWYHPFDYLHAMKDNGYDELDTEFPIDRDAAQSWSNDWYDIRDKWEYKGCEGERHADVTPVTNTSKPANHACNLYQHIVGGDGCGCGPGSNAARDWYDSNIDEQCWSDCMAAYIEQTDTEVVTAFGGAVDQLQSFVQNLSFAQRWKAILGTNGSQCDESSLIDIAHCEDAFNYIGQSYAGKTEVSDSTVPGGCSLRISDNFIVINSADSADSGCHGHADYKPLCGAMFFPQSSDTLPLNAQMVKTEKLTSSDGSVTMNMQGDGNLVVKKGDSVIWHLATNGNNDAYVQFDYPGNLVLYSSDGTSLWSSGVQDGATKLVLQNNCTLDIIDIHGDVVWTNLDNSDSGHGTSC